MAVTKEKKVKAPAKPKAAKSAAAAAHAKPSVAEQVKAHSVTHEEIAALARSFWEQRGHHHGQHEQDWLRAEHELRSKAS